MNNTAHTAASKISRAPGLSSAYACPPVADNLLLTTYAALKLRSLFDRPERLKRPACWAAVQRRNSAPLKRPASTQPQVRGYSASAWLAGCGKSALQFVQAALEPSVQLARRTAQTGAQGIGRAVALLEAADNWLSSWTPGLPGAAAAAQSSGWRGCFHGGEPVSPQPGCEWAAQPIVEIMEHLGFEAQVLGGMNISSMSLENMTLIGPDYLQSCLTSACPELLWKSRRTAYSVINWHPFDWRAFVWAPGSGWKTTSPSFPFFESLADWMSSRLPPSNGVAIIEVMNMGVDVTAIAEARWQPAIIFTYPWAGLPPWEIAATPPSALPGPAPAPAPGLLPAPALQPSPADPVPATGPANEDHSRLPLALMGSGMAVCLVIAGGAVTWACCYTRKSREARSGESNGPDHLDQPKVQTHRSGIQPSHADVITTVPMRNMPADADRLSGGESSGGSSGNDADNP